MSLVSGSIPNFISGISQQAFSLRLASQAEEQTNGWPSVVDGLDKRPPFEHGAILSGSYGTDAYVHTINRDATERYVVVVAGGDLRVFRLADGAEVTVNFPDGKGYLTGSSYSAVTVADFTFLVNRSVVTAMDTATVAPGRNPEALVAVRVGNYSTTYSITLDGGGGAATASYTTSNTDAETIRTDRIASELRTIIAGWAGGSEWHVDQIGSTLHIRRADNGDFTIRTADSYGDQGMIAVKGKVQVAELLPARAVSGFLVEVEGAAGNRFDNRWLQYQDSATANGQGVWSEVPKPGRLVRFNAATLPHVLVREADATFTFRKAQWADCRAGDENVSPTPGWIGLPISDVFFYRNRLGFIGGEQIGMSRNGEFFSFWRETAQQVLDTDPIDVSVSHVKVSNLHWAVPFNETLLLFSDQTQFIDNSGSVLSPATVDFRQVTEFEADVRTRPQGIGPFIYFPSTRGDYSSIREYYLDGASRAANANDVTAHVPRFIAKNVRDMGASPTEDCLALACGCPHGSIWIYKFQFSGQEKVQSAWTRWSLGEGARVLGVEFINSSMWAIVLRGDKLALERVDLDPDRGLGDLSFVPKLDRLILGTRCASVTYNATAKTTAFSIGFDMWRNGDTTEPCVLEAVVITPFNGFPAGHRFVFPTDGAGVPGASAVLNLPGDWSSSSGTDSVVFGRRYELRHRFSTLLVRSEASGGGLVAVTDGRLQLGVMRVNFTNTGYFRAEVTPLRRQTYTYPFTGRVVGSARSPIGRLALETGTFAFPIRTRNMDAIIDLVNDSPWPSRLLNAEWEGVFTPRGKRVE